MYRYESAQTPTRSTYTCARVPEGIARAKMPGVPAEGGWGGAGRTLGIQMEGFSEEEIARAVDFCDNDKIKSE